MTAAEQTDLPPPPAAALAYGFARRHGVVIDGTICAHRATARLDALLEVQRVAGPALTWEAIDDAAFEARLRACYRDGPGDAAADVAADHDLAALAGDAAAIDDLLDSRDESPVIRLINAVLLEAIKAGASDIHVETQERRCLIRARVDGVLRELVEPARALAPLLISRIKVMAQLDIAEKRVPQDGRVSLRIGGHEIDVRVSTLPGAHGERVVLRLLDRDTAALDLDRIGMGARDAAVFARLLGEPHGLVLVTGPTGAGKTTTLYAALNRMNDRRRNIMTIEDPIEYEIEGIGQMQVNPRIDLDFARGLRAILRQDPDVVMVGEIRDAETASMAVRASMTGHVVLSTLHTNSAVGSITRLADMGVERYLLAPMLVGVVAQRLVRTLCPDCRVAGAATPGDSAAVGGLIAPGTPLFRAGGCARCHGEGYRGRTGVYEVVEVDAAMQALIHAGAAEADIAAAARAGGPALLDDGVAKVIAGVTSIDEIIRVVHG